ncbi:Biotin/lipoate A/B protein ligase [Clydaea vesicula]|uniref:Putative lipoate-protein ligase A n=1 Tax=Clydaea vesicula TaxID=447962 RepID=A0AAD5U2Q8_9FUNG|nr:Biotin/lipoate A/B protein ligase [Clydaea vesicula]
MNNRRRSGGGTVYHDEGNSNFCVMMPRLEFTRRKNAVMVSNSLNRLGLDTQVNDRHDITLANKKISGSAFKVIKERAYHHGTMLIDSDLKQISGLLTGKDNIIGRGVGSVKSEVTRLSDYSKTITHDLFSKSLMKEFIKTYQREDSKLILDTDNDGEFNLLEFSNSNDIFVKELTMKDFNSSKELNSIYNELSSFDWIIGQTPDFIETSEKFDFYWGQLQFNLVVKEGLIFDFDFKGFEVDPYVQGIEILEICEILKGVRYSTSEVQRKIFDSGLEISQEMKEFVNALANMINFDH